MCLVFFSCGLMKSWCAGFSFIFYGPLSDASEATQPVVPGLTQFSVALALNQNLSHVNFKAVVLSRGVGTPKGDTFWSSQDD